MAVKKKVPEAVMVSTGRVENKFSKEQLIASERFRERRDILGALLDDGRMYTAKSVEERIESYMKGKVR